MIRVYLYFLDEVKHRLFERIRDDLTVEMYMNEK